VGHVRLTRRRRALLGYITGCAAMVAGIYLVKGLAAALIVAGVICAVSFLLLTDVEEVTGEPPAASAAPPVRGFDPTL
jgi:hypothetical protein